MNRGQQTRLREKLATIPRIAEDIAITECLQARANRPGLSMGRRPKKLGSRIPFHIGAAAAAHELRRTLADAVRHTCETHDIDYWPVGYTHMADFIGPLQKHEKRIPRGYDATAPMATSKWLWKYASVFAKTEGSERLGDHIIGAILQCEREIQGPVDGGIESVVIDDKRIEAANRNVVTKATIDVVAGRLGDRGAGLNAERLRTLVRYHGLQHTSIDKDSGTKFYALGDVLALHKEVQTRAPRSA